MTDTEKKPEELKLERETCGRCSGNGRHGLPRNALLTALLPRKEKK